MLSDLSETGKEKKGTSFSLVCWRFYLLSQEAHPSSTDTSSAYSGWFRCLYVTRCWSYTGKSLYTLKSRATKPILAFQHFLLESGLLQDTSLWPASYSTLAESIRNVNYTCRTSTSLHESLSTVLCPALKTIFQIVFARCCTSTIVHEVSSNTTAEPWQAMERR